VTGGYRRTADKYRGLQLDAARFALEALRERGIDCDIQPISARTRAIVDDRWTAIGRKYPGWGDWSGIQHDHRSDMDWCFAIWAGDHLSALVALKVRKDYLLINFLEGDPGDGDPLRAHRADVALEAALMYADLCDVSEVRIEPKNRPLIRWYQKLAAFEPFPSEDDPAYFRLEL
jgi:hypothetical protein